MILRGIEIKLGRDQALVSIDGSYGEGGGQVLRGAVALSCLTGQPATVFNIRGRRPKPGLQPQHLISIEAAAVISGAEVDGAIIGSTEIAFRPKEIVGGSYVFDIKTAGSVTMVVQTVLPMLIFADQPSEIRVIGGTDVPWSPPVDYMKHVALPALGAMGVEAGIEVLRRGHYPKGGGEVVLKAMPVKSVRPIRALERGPVQSIRGVSHCTNLPEHVSVRQAASAERLLREKGNANVRISTEVQNTGGSLGSGIVLWAEVGGDLRIGSDALGAREKRSEEVGSEAAGKLLAELQTGLAVDRHLGDMLIPYMAIANGVSEAGLASLTTHSETMMWITKAFLDVEWQVKKTPAGAAVIRVDGAGIVNRRE
jgi:RNA 3'-terminal phosphate cyclase (ATP)